MIESSTPINNEWLSVSMYLEEMTRIPWHRSRERRLMQQVRESCSLEVEHLEPLMFQSLHMARLVRLKYEALLKQDKAD